MYSERDRLAFIEQRDGKEAAIDFARRTLKLYKQALIKPKHTFIRPIRLSLHESVRFFKYYLRKNSENTVNSDSCA
jgi:hypothetical protein